MIMENSYYLLSKQRVEIERFHICTWDTIDGTSFVEFGIEIEQTDKLNSEIDICLILPFINNKCTITSLHKELSDEANCRFVFNDIVKNKKPIDGDGRNGNIIEFENRKKLAILPNKSSIEQDRKNIKITIKKIPDYEGPIYTRILIRTNYDTLATKKNGITKNTYIYDVKVNETRNLLDEVFLLKKQENLNFCRINNLFCLHSVPDNYEISFIDSQKLKNIRKLEFSAFQKYLPCIKSLKEDKYIITFNKDSRKDSYSFFSCFTEETIGSKQILLAIGANIFCSLLFAVSSFRLMKVPDIAWYKQIPCEYWIALVVVISFAFGLLISIKKIGHICRWFKK